MKKTCLLLLTSALIALPSLANAELYAGVGGGVLIPREETIKTTAQRQDVSLGKGWGALGAIGYKFDNGFRTELEFGFRDADIDHVASSAIDDGGERAYSAMVNGLYDFKTGTLFTPYLGAGLGVGKVNYDSVRTISGGQLDDNATGLAVQGIAGVSLAINESLSFFTQYQYQSILDLKTSTSNGLSAKSEYGTSLISAGLRWEFALPKPARQEQLTPIPLSPTAAAPAELPETKEVVAEPVEVIAAPAVEKYMVFFDFDRSDLTIEAADILKKVVDNAKAGKVTSIELTGHADRAGSDAYNIKLSERRANAVKKQLIRLGLPAAEIDTVAKGERPPLLVQTGDGVREPQNRRVEIVYGK
jgi:outer membrane protein OmpA-like peptidoglycan-associated protein